MKTLLISICLLVFTSIQAVAEPELVMHNTYTHNGSLVTLREEEGSVSIFYEDPRPGMRKEGVQPGTLLFRGNITGRDVFGVAYVFKRGCDNAAYLVKGRVLNNYLIKLSGAAPNFSGCDVVGYSANVNSFLVFVPFYESQEEEE